MYQNLLCENKLVALTIYCMLTLLQAGVNAQQKVIYLYDGPAPGSESWTWSEGETTKTPINTKVVYNVTRPSLTVFSPDRKVANGSAVIIAPGGGGRVLLFEKEGVTTAKELVKKGVTVFVLKYRLGESKTDDPWQEMMAHLRDSTRRRDTVSTVGLLARSDLENAVKYVRQHAQKYRIDPNRVGLIGFSNGAGMTLIVITSGSADAKPNFAAVNYGVRRIELKVPVEHKIPLFIAAATDDQMAPVSNSIRTYNDWLAAGQSVEIHLYAKGRSDIKGAPAHGLNGFPANTWVHRFLDWMDSMGFLHRIK